MCKRYHIEWNADVPEKYLLSNADELGIIRYVQSLKKDLEDWRFEHSMWSKYHDSFWFQRGTGLTKEMMLEKFYRLANLIVFFEPELEAYEAILNNHRRAVEMLHSDMTYLKKINIATTELKQQSFF